MTWTDTTQEVADGAEQPWLSLDGHQGLIEGFNGTQVVGWFSALSADLPEAGRTVTVTLGVDGESSDGLGAVVLSCRGGANGTRVMLELIESAVLAPRRGTYVAWSGKAELVPCDGRVGDDRLTGEVVELSTGGVTVAVDKHIPSGTAILIRFRPPGRGAGTLQLRARVASGRVQADGRQRIAVQFTRLLRHHHELLSAAVAAAAAGR